MKKELCTLFIFMLFNVYTFSFSSGNETNNNSVESISYYSEIEDELEEINSLARSMSKAVSLEENPQEDAYISILEFQYEDSDELLNKVYKKLMNSLDKKGKEKIRNKQRKWVKDTYEKADKMEKFDRLYFLVNETQEQTLVLAQIYSDN